MQINFNNKNKPSRSLWVPALLAALFVLFAALPHKHPRESYHPHNSAASLERPALDCALCVWVSSPHLALAAPPAASPRLFLPVPPTVAPPVVFSWARSLTFAPSRGPPA